MVVHVYENAKKSELVKNKSYQKDYTSVPKNTIRLIEEAEKFKN